MFELSEFLDFFGNGFSDGFFRSKSATFMTQKRITQFELPASTGHRSNHNVPMKTYQYHRKFTGNGESDPPQAENFQNFGSACKFSLTNPTISEPQS